MASSRAGAVTKSIAPPMLSTTTPSWSATVAVIESGADNGDPLSGPLGCCQPNLPYVLREEEDLNTLRAAGQATLPHRTCALLSATRTWKAMEGLEGQMSDSPTDSSNTGTGVSSEGLLPQLVQHLRRNRTALREEWARRITEAELLTAMTPEEIFSEATAVYDNYVEVLETGSVEARQA